MEIGALLVADKLLYLCPISPEVPRKSSFSIWFIGSLGVYLVSQLADIYSQFHYIAREYVFVQSTVTSDIIFCLYQNFVGRFPSFQHVFVGLWKGHITIVKSPLDLADLTL